MLNSILSTWLNVPISSDSADFATCFINANEIQQTIDFAFDNEQPSFKLKLSVAGAAKPLEIDCQMDLRNNCFVGIIPLETNASSLDAESLQMANSIPAIIWSLNADGYCVFLNSHWTLYTGLSISESLGFSWLNAVHKDDRLSAKSTLEQSVKERCNYKVNLRIKNSDGEYRWCLDQGQPRFAADGSYCGMAGTLIDVHEQNIANQNSIYREEELVSMVESAPFPIGVYIGQELRIKIANQTMLDTWGKGNNVIGKLYTEILPELDGQQVFQELLSVLDSGVAVHKKYNRIDLVVNKVLRTFYFNYSFTPLLDNSGKVYGVMNTAVDVTELILARSKSQQNELKFTKLLETAPAGIAVFIGTDYIIETHNKTFESIYNDATDIIGHSVFDVLPHFADNRSQLQNILDAVFSSGRQHESFGTPIHAVVDDMLVSRFYNFTYTPMFDENNNVYAILHIAVDVTENMISQHKVLESEKSLRNTILHAPVAMCIIKNSNFTVEIANNKMLELWQIDEGIIGKPFFEYVPSAQSQGLENLLTRVMETGETITAIEKQFFRVSNGISNYIFVDFVYEPFRDTNDQIVGVFVVARDVTQQKFARQKIEEAEARARLAIEAGDLGVYELDISSRTLIASKRFSDIWGVENANNSQMLISKMHPEDRPARLSAHQQSLLTGNLEYEARILQDDGSFTWYKAKGKILNDEQGNPKTLIGVIQDITEQKLFAAELTRLVSQRTTELKRSNDDLQQFAHVASHDLKEPVRKIKFYSNMLQDQFSEILPAKALSHLSKIHNATDRMFSMIEGVLKYSSIQGTSKDIETIDLEQLFNNVAADLEVIINTKNVVIKREPLPVIEGVPVLIHQLFYNIMNNAVKFSSSGATQPLIEVRCKIEKISDVEMVKISISDNGIGLDENYITKIFNPFIRLNPKDKYEGTGLGLSLCKKIAEQHFGTIEAIGSEGKGATFIIRLPLKQDVHVWDSKSFLD